MNTKLKKKLEKTIAVCADKAVEASTAVEAMQFTQAAVNVSNVIIGMTLNVPDKPEG